MRAVFFGIFLARAGCGESLTDKKVDAITAKLDAIERSSTKTRWTSKKTSRPSSETFRICSAPIESRGQPHVPAAVAARNSGDPNGWLAA